MSMTRARAGVWTMGQVLSWVCAAGAASCSSPAGPSPADLIVTNARIWTVDTQRPTAEAVAVRGDRIVAVGKRADADRWRGPATRMIDVGGRRVVPGFDDAHIHLLTGGMGLENVDLKDAATPEEFVRRIADAVRRVPAGEWLLGGNWDEQAWPGAPLPAKDLIDGVTGQTPVFLSRYDEHMALANTAALTRAGVTARTPDPPGGCIVRDAAGAPTGLLKDAAMGYVNKVVPAPTRERRERALRRALEHMASLGVTSVQDMGPDYDDVALYATLAGRGALTARIAAAPPERLWIERAGSGPPPAFDQAFLHVRAVKGFADGSLGSTTAYFFEPYLDAPQTTGLLSDEMQPLEGMRSRLVQADEAGQQLAIHAIGDRAISMVLDLFAEVQQANGLRDRRFRIEHAQHVAPRDFARFASLGVIASVQPYHAIDDGRWAERRIGPVRARTTYAFRTFLDHQVRLAFGTDWPVAPLDPMQGLYAATTRATLDGRQPGGWVPEQKISIEQAIEAYTLGSAYAEFEDREKGSITPGKLADMVVLSEDVLAVPPEQIRNVKVVTTIVGGKVVYERR